MEIRYGNVKLYQINTILNDYNLFNYLYYYVYNISFNNFLLI
jgi:hypothetical protein